jgi:hypothetical protein
MNILKLAQLVEKFSSVVKKAIALDFKLGHGYLLLKTIEVPSFSSSKMYTVPPGTLLVYLGSEEDPSPKTDPNLNLFPEEPAMEENHYWNLSGWGKDHATRKFNPEPGDLLDVKNFLREVARLLPDGEVDSLPMSNLNVGRYVYVIRSSIQDGKHQLSIKVEFERAITIEVTDSRQEEGEFVENIPGLYELGILPGQSKSQAIAKESAIELFTSPEKFLSAILPHITSRLYESRSSMLDTPSPLDPNEDH